MHAELTRGMGVVVSENLVAELMRIAGIAGLPGPVKVKRLKGVATAHDLTIGNSRSITSVICTGAGLRKRARGRRGRRPRRDRARSVDIDPGTSHWTACTATSNPTAASPSRTSRHRCPDRTCSASSGGT
ncbi:hypothetical protein [Saccharopolyspora dendranthemae]|uniref:hypothetical protein n=1 Tax=Saccharopolyspora dendranthemae TaxID=1181886 RepID=UPI003CCC5DBA